MILIHELRDALRRLLRRPGYSLLSIVVLGVGLGLALFVYNLVHALILAPLPYPHPDRLVAFGELRQANGGAGDTGVGIDELDSDQYLLLQRSLAGIDAIGAYAPVGIAVDVGGSTAVHEGARFTASMLDLLGATPLLGRGFTAQDETPGAPDVVLIGETLWRQQFGADPQIVGRPVRVDGGWATVIGVLPAAFGFPGRSEMWRPMRLQPHQYDDIFGVGGVKAFQKWAGRDWSQWSPNPDRRRNKCLEGCGVHPRHQFSTKSTCNHRFVDHHQSTSAPDRLIDGRPVDRGH